MPPEPSAIGAVASPPSVIPDPPAVRAIPMDPTRNAFGQAASRVADAYPLWGGVLVLVAARALQRRTCRSASDRPLGIRWLQASSFLRRVPGNAEDTRGKEQRWRRPHVK